MNNKEKEIEMLENIIKALINMSDEEYEKNYRPIFEETIGKRIIELDKIVKEQGLEETLKQITNESGTMTYIPNKNTTLEKELVAKQGLEEMIEQDKKNNDLKSLEYHTMALEQTNKNIERLKLDNNEK